MENHGHRSGKDGGGDVNGSAGKNLFRPKVRIIPEQSTQFPQCVAVGGWFECRVITSIDI
jgi:hypothetical protein